MINKNQTKLKAKEAFCHQLTKEQKKSVIEAGKCDPDDIYERCQRVSIIDSENELERTDINFPCAREDQSNWIGGLDDCTCTESSSFMLISAKGNHKSSYSGSVVVVKKKR